MENDLINSFKNVDVSIKELSDSIENFKKSIPTNISILDLGPPKVEKIKYIPVEISKLDIHDGDTILLTFNLDECDINTILNIHKMWEEVLPKTVKIISTVKPVVESVQIIHNNKEEEKPF